MLPQHRCRNPNIRRQTCEDGATQRSLSCSDTPALHSSSFPSLQRAASQILPARLDLKALKLLLTGTTPKKAAQQPLSPSTQGKVFLGKQ